MAKNNLQKVANEIVKWTKETDFNISDEKMKARSKPRVYERPKLKVRLGPNAIKMVRQHRILGLIIDDRLNWRGTPERCEGTSHIEESIYGTSHKTSIRTDTQHGRETSIRSFCDLQNGKYTLQSSLPNALGNERTEHDNCSNTSTNE
jgi:hypothetical protein